MVCITVCVYTGAIQTGGDSFSANARAPRLSQLNCTGSEARISECTNYTQDTEVCSASMSYAVAVCQGETLIVIVAG